MRKGNSDLPKNLRNSCVVKYSVLYKLEGHGHGRNFEFHYKQED